MIKRGQIVLKFTIILIISAVVIISFVNIGQAYGKGTVYRKTIAAREIPLIIDALYSYPYDSIVYYNKDLSGLTVEIIDGKVKVYDSKSIVGKDMTSRQYGFFPTGQNKIEAKLEDPKNIRFEKKNNIIVIKKDEATIK